MRRTGVTGYNYRAFGLEGLANLSMRSGIGTGYIPLRYKLQQAFLKHGPWPSSIGYIQMVIRTGAWRRAAIRARASRRE